MGCDIHMYVEYRRKGDSKWHNGDHFKIDPYDSNFEVIELHGSRDYQLFSTLCGVRDYSGNVIPVSEPKGFPQDASEYTIKCKEYWDGDGHNYSWNTLKELKQYHDNNPIMYYSGFISREQQIDLDNGILPNSWCKGTNQEGYERREWSIPNKSLTPLIEKLEKRCKEIFQYDWQDYDDSNEENIRIVYWFDN